MNSIIRGLENIGCEFIQRFPMRRFTSLRVGGIADLIVYPKTCSELINLINMLSSFKVKWVVLGAGSNTIVYDEGFRGVIIVTRKLKSIEILRDCSVIAEAGAVLGTILNKTIRVGLTGFEFAAGIPGTVGGGIFMNAGANGGEIKDVVDKVWILEEGKEHVLDRDEIRFEYRNSNLPDGSIVMRARFKLRPGDTNEIERNVRDYLYKRSITQPIKISNTGSIFKNPPEIPAGKLLDELGFKGLKEGGASFSDIHANFIVNSGHANTSDVLRLIEIAQEHACSRRGVQLETEVKIIGDKLG